MTAAMTRDYGNSEREQLAEFVHGDAGFEWAIAQTVARLPANARHIVHFGCGIGWLTAEVKRNRPRASVAGIDPSKTAVATAMALFGEDGLGFELGDIATLAREPGQLADALILSGTEEMLSGDARSDLVRAVSASTIDGAVILLHLRGTEPSTDPSPGLRELAEALCGTITYQAASFSGRENHSILLIERGGPQLPDAGHAGHVRVQGRKRRRELVSSRLGLRVAPAGTLIPDRTGPAVLVVSPNENSLFETFLNAQLEELPTRVEVLFGIPPDSRDADGRRLIPKWARALERLLRKPLGRSTAARIDEFILGRFIRKRRIRVVLAEYGPTGTRLLETCDRHSLPLVTQFFGYDAYDRPTVEGLRTEYRRLLGEEAATIAVSRDMQSRLYELGARPGSVHWIPCGADPDRFSTTHAELNPPVFLAAGQFVEKKAPQLTLLAFSRVVRDVPEARLQMVGGGPLLDACRQLADALGIAGSVEFLGFIAHEDLADLMRGARAFVQHSMTAPSGDSEGTPVAILEAGAAGLPVVATRHGGIPEVVLDGVTGYLVDEGDVEAMADRMRQLAVDPALAGRLGAQARTHVIEQFAQSATLDHLWQVLQGAIADHGEYAPTRRSGQRA